MNTPSIYTPASLARTTEGVSCGLPDGRWVAARPEGWHGICLRKRLRCAWMVFTGRADVLRWEDAAIGAAKADTGASDER